MQRLTRRDLARLVAIGTPSLAIASVIVWILQDRLGVPNPSAVYIVAVVATAFASGSAGGIVVSIAAFLLYDFFFTEPRFTFSISEPAEWVGVLLLLFVGVVVGELAALQRSRADVARAREREAQALFRVSRALATRATTPGVLPELTAILRTEAGMSRVWIALGADAAAERVAADTGDGARPAVPAIVCSLRRTPGDQPAQWVRLRQASPKARAQPGFETYRVRVEAGSVTFGSIWAQRDRALGLPGRTETRLLAASADQLGQALAHERLEADAQAAEIARQADALKSALLQSVSHDLRTPLATIRAAAGTLRPGSGLSVADQAESADAIDREVEYLNRLVTNLLDLSRIEAGALRAERDVFELEDLVGRTVDRLRPRLAGHPMVVSLDAPSVEVDAIFVDEAVTNALENAIKYTPADAEIRLGATAIGGEPFVRLTIEDGGPGVPEEHLERVFEKFYRVPSVRRSSRSGTGIGLAVVRGLVEAMGGRVAARRSALGGLALDLDLPVASAATDTHAA
ncbi:MAG TPA: ATP-binding protein [Candidatus Dormibacteraeota bacterium]|nr:ATP-binding protein [Candidatus Dormibacteraeota bacterium]